MRAYNALRRNDVDTVGDLLRLSDRDLLRIRNLGQKALTEIRQRLTASGLEPTPPPERADWTAEAEWIGHQLDVIATDLRAVPKSAYIADKRPTFEKRRYAWGMYQWAVKGCEPTDYPRDKAGGPGWYAHAMPGSLEVHLEGLNRLAYEELGE